LGSWEKGEGALPSVEIDQGDIFALGEEECAAERGIASVFFG
jgi:hypothetical protein